jgi:hypothetical protein
VSLFTDLDEMVNYRVTYARAANKDQHTRDPRDIEITPFVAGFEVHSSLEMSFRVGVLFIKDPIGFREQIGFVGNDIITIDYGPQNLSIISDYQKSVTFRIISIDEQADFSNDVRQLHKNRNLVLTLAEFPLYDYFIGNEIYKTYKWGTPNAQISISDIVKDLLDEEISPGLQNGWGYDVDVEDTKGVSNPELRGDFYIPRWTLLKTMDYFTDYAISLRGNYPYYIFNARDTVDNDGDGKTISFRSIYSFFNDTVPGSNRVANYINRETYNAMMNNNISRAILSDGSNVIMAWRYQYFNGVDMAFSGLSGRTYIKYDYESGLSAEAYDHRTFMRENKDGMGSYFIHQGKYGDQWSSYKYSPYTTPETNNDYQKNIYARKNFRSIGCEALCYLSATRNLGTLASLTLPSVDTESGESVTDDMMNNEPWLTWSIVDVVNRDNSGYSRVEFRKDSLFLSTQLASDYETAGG